MIPVVKGGEPKALTEAKRDIRNTPDAPFDYSSLQGENKRKVLEALVTEQGHLCAYCMCRIGTDNSPATIEHIIPQHPTSINPDGGLSLSYKNMLAVCDGRNGATCDKRRGNRPLTVNPTKPETLASIAYQRDGTIRSINPEIDHDLRDTLGLNDGRTNLCANRSEAMRAIEQIVASLIVRKKINDSPSAKRNLCVKILEHYESQTDMKDEYLGAKLFKARKLVAKFSA